MKNSTIGIGIIGTGGVCNYGHFPAMERARGAQLAALCDINKQTCEELAKRHQVPKVYCDHHELLADPRIDAVIVATPNFLHKPIAIDALRAGKHVFCEKPLALTAADAAEVVAAARDSGQKLMVDFTHRFWNRSIKLHEAIAGGKLGNVYYIRAGWLRRRGTPSWGNDSWFTRKSLAGGGCLIDIGCHMIDLTLWLIGSWDLASVSGYVTQRIKKKPDLRETDNGQSQDVEDFAAASLTLKNGAHIHIEVAWALNMDRAKNSFIDVYGTAGGASWRVPDLLSDDPVPQLSFYCGPGEQCLAQPARLEPETPSEGWVRAVQHFIDCIRNGVQPESSGAEGLKVVQILEAASKSLKVNGARVELPVVRHARAAGPVLSLA